MNGMRKIMSCLCLVLCILSPLSAAGKKEAVADSQVNLSFMGWGTDAEIATYKTLIENFEKMYPNVKVEYIVVADNEFDTKLQTMIGAKEVPDVFYCQIDKFMKYTATGNLLDITKFVESNEIFEKENVWNSIIDLYRYDGKQLGKGPIYALPKDVSVFPIFYNVDLFKAAGVTPPTIENPWDWNDYLQAAKKLTSGSGSNKVYGSGAYSLESAVWSNGADFVDAETLSKITIDSPAFIEALQWASDLRLVHKVVPTVAESNSLSDYDRFKQGNLAMVGAGTWSLGDFWANCDFEFDVMNWPVSPKTGKSEIWFGSAGLAVSSQTKHPEEASNLAAYLSFYEDSQRTAYQKGQAIPMFKNMAIEEFGSLDKDPKHKEVFFDILENHARVATQSKTFTQDWFSDFNSNVPAVFNGEKSAEEFCKGIKPSLQKLLDESIELSKEYSL
ncbi:MAG: sugar ABC transporter substrate-binding protein [Sphaerochaeta sp.]|nr:sugar ABC transporter substrate-binding protein [Sphaerochaeta sp.]